MILYYSPLEKESVAYLFVVIDDCKRRNLPDYKSYCSIVKKVVIVVDSAFVVSSWRVNCNAVFAIPSSPSRYFF